MAVSLSALTTSLSSLSFSSHISQRPNTLSFARTESLSVSVSRFPKTPSSLVVSATALAEPETEDLKNYVKSRLPGGFAAQTIIGTGRRKSAIARVVLQEGTGKFIINYRDAKVSSLPFFLSVFVSNYHPTFSVFVDFIIIPKFELCSSTCRNENDIEVYYVLVKFSCLPN